MTTDPTPPRRKWHFQRWLLLLAIALLAYAGWTTYAFRSALSQAKALGWAVEYTDPVETIRANWKRAFKKETWLDGVTGVRIPTSEAFEQHLAIVHRLNPKALIIEDTATLRDLSALKPLDQLKKVWLFRSLELTNLGGFENLSALQRVVLTGCPRLSNVDALKNLSALRDVWIYDCTGLSKESVAALKAALPNARICIDIPRL